MSLVLPTVLWLAGIAFAQDVSYNFDAEADFTTFRTYKWVQIKSSDLDELVAKQIQQAVDMELAKKGLKKMETESADLYVGYLAAIRTEKELQTWETGWDHGPGWRRGRGARIETATESTLHIGSLQLDFYEVSKKRTVFRTVGSKTVNPNAKPEKRLKALQKAVAKMLKDFPPKKKQANKP